MKISEVLLVGFDEEMAATRKTLERVPFEEKGDWKPHEKSSALASLATHVGTLPRFAGIIAGTDSLELGSDPRPPKPETLSALLAVFDGHVKTAREAISGMSDEMMIKPWTLSYQGKQIFSVPRVHAFKIFFQHHLVHHRAQLGVYLRLNDIPVPGTYGSSADEPVAM